MQQGDFVEVRSGVPQLLKIPVKDSVSIIGLGYVGAVSCACLAALGHRVVGVDVDQVKVDAIAAGRSPIHEKDLDTLLSTAVESDLLTASLNIVDAVLETDVTFVSVGTPTAADGGCDFRYIEEVASQIGQALALKDSFHVVVLRCSVPPGTTMSVMAPILQAVSGKTLGVDFGLAFNPEFLREGVAIADFRGPPKTVIGASDDRTGEIVSAMFKPVDEMPIRCAIEEAELVKYVDNVWHATKVCFANEVGRLAKSYHVDGQSIMRIFARDTKLNISDYYLTPGFAYGGSCLPKEVRAVNYLAEVRNLELPLIGAIAGSNACHIEQALSMARQTGAKRIAILGVAFKPGTDDLRESPILEVMAALADEGIELVVHDFAITSSTDIAGQMAYVAHGAPHLSRFVETLPEMLTSDVETALSDVEAVIVTHRDPVYRTALLMRPDLHVVDLVRIFDAVPRNRRYSGIGW